jgi:hypothetical protein
MFWVSNLLGIHLNASSRKPATGIILFISAGPSEGTGSGKDVWKWDIQGSPSISIISNKII